jgi:cellulase/cellobiase CelA1
MSFPVSTFFNDAVSRGYAQRAWYLTSIQAGFEPWQGGVGLAVNNFSVTTGGGTTTTSGQTTTTSGQTTTTSGQTTTTTGSGSRSCAVTWVVQSQWQDGFVADLTIRNTGSLAINSWTLAWTFSGNQRITNAWGLTWTQSGQSVTARSVDYTSRIPVSGSVTAGFQATYSGTNSPPTSIQCTAT